MKTVVLGVTDAGADSGAGRLSLFLPGCLEQSLNSGGKKNIAKDEQLPYSLGTWFVFAKVFLHSILHYSSNLMGQFFMKSLLAWILLCLLSTLLHQTLPGLILSWSLCHTKTYLPPRRPFPNCQTPQTASTHIPLPRPPKAPPPPLPTPFRSFPVNSHLLQLCSCA